MATCVYGCGVCTECCAAATCVSGCGVCTECCAAATCVSGCGVCTEYRAACEDGPDGPKHVGTNIKIF